MTVSWQLMVRLALQGILVLALAFVGDTSERPCSPMPGVSTAGDVTSNTDVPPGAAGVVSAELAENSVKTERNPVTPVTAVGRVTALGDGIRSIDRVPTRSTLTTPSPFYLSHCAFLC